jgi:hypothetical protein
MDEDVATGFHAGGAEYVRPAANPPVSDDATTASAAAMLSMRGW